jgi:hypothetical protein
MRDILDIISTPEYKTYSKKYKATIGFNMTVNAVVLDIKDAIYSLDETGYDEALRLINESNATGKNTLYDSVADKPLEADPDVVY